MADLEHDVIDMEGRKVGVAVLDGRVFGAPAHEKSVHAAVRRQLAKRRAGTHATLNRTRMKGGGRKPFRQKGTGNARAGSNTSPLWYGGAAVHGPMPRSYEFKLPKQVRRQALASVLSERRQSGRLYILDALTVASGKTKDMQAVLARMGIADKRVALVLPGAEASPEAAKVWRAARNLENVIALPVEGVNVYDLLRAEALAGTRETIAALQKRVSGAAGESAAKSSAENAAAADSSGD